MKNELEYQNFKGLFVFCNKCKSNIHNNQKGKRKCTHPLEKQVYKAIVNDPNAGGQRRTKISEYGVQLQEKQKVRFTYGVSEKQFKNAYSCFWKWRCKFSRKSDGNAR